MDGTHLSDLEQSSSLCRGQIAPELKSPFHAIEAAAFCLALSAVDRVNSGMPEANRDFLQRPLLSSRVQRDRHRRSTAECRKQQIVWRRTSISAAVRKWFVCQQTMRARRDLLCEPAARSPNGDARFVRYVVGSHIRDRLRRIQLTGLATVSDRFDMAREYCGPCRGARAERVGTQLSQLSGRRGAAQCVSGYGTTSRRHT